MAKKDRKLTDTEGKALMMLYGIPVQEDVRYEFTAEGRTLHIEVNESNPAEVIEFGKADFSKAGIVTDVSAAHL